MKFYLIEITTYTDGTKDSVGVYTYDDLTSALSNFHKKLGGAMGNEKYKSELCQVINSFGAIQAVEFWQRESE